jgi:small redox-active disulfide protein 2
MHIKVLGPGCKKCNETERLIKEAVEETGCDATVEHIDDIAEIAKHGVFSTPTVVIDGQVKSVGKVPAKTDIRTWLGK